MSPWEFLAWSLSIGVATIIGVLAVALIVATVKTIRKQD